MVALPVEGRWSIKPVHESDLHAVLAFLRRDPLINIYLISRLVEEPNPAATQIFAIRHNGELHLVAALGTNIVMAASPRPDPACLATALDLLAERIVGRMLPVRAIISPERLVDLLWTRLRAHVDPPTVVRMTQPVYALRPRFGFPGLETVRYSTRADLDQLVRACAAMHLEEVGIDPLERDAVAYAERIRELVEKERSLVRVENGTIVAKCEFSAITEGAVQLMGVWTRPEYRRKGYGRRLLQEVSGHLFRKGKIVTLFVNDFNTPAVAMYEALGFERIGINRALIW
ncbi:MAG TPA: GNAT family N-acetyltransferase [Thermoanaerobaculia bacterium]|nr:GNAT family N-acetyltransferase [Thermoanaerobaculia bacterium]